MNRRATGRLIIGTILLLWVVGVAMFLAPTSAAQSGDDASRSMSDIRDRLSPPPVSDPPTLVELGHTEYYLYCMVCHGDRGQGLTEEWRNAGDPADANCWQSRCHAANHPPDGFELPRYAPPVIGDYTLARFATIGDLHEYIQFSMPWHMPGFLEDEQYQRIAVYLADANGITGLNSDLDWMELAARAPTSRTSVAQPVVQAAVSEAKVSNQIWVRPLLILAGAGLVVGGVAWVRRRRR
ncbi:MAG: hypothetical protein HY328_07150 [Chloroflexi bacterium]|nr:hypothetical protein [Chloroflexota bacterium]